jgi:hypothetical protein
MSNRKSKKRRHQSINHDQAYKEKQDYLEKNRMIAYLAHQINATAPEEVREKRKGMNPAAIVLLSRIEDENKYPSDFKLMMDRIWRNVSDWKRRESIRLKGESYGRN